MLLSTIAISLEIQLKPYILWAFQIRALFYCCGLIKNRGVIDEFRVQIGIDSTFGITFLL